MIGESAAACQASTGSGWAAKLDLRYERRGNRTVVSHRAHEGPLVVQRALYPEGDSVCQSVVVHPPGGLVGGDRLELRVTAGAGAHAQLLTPGAARWYRSNGAAAVQRVSVSVDDGARVEWLPQEAIAFDGAIARSELRVELAGSGTWIGWEIFCLGRRCAGERFSNGSLRQRTEILRDSKLQWYERGVLPANAPLIGVAAGLNACSVFGTFLAAAERIPDDLLVRCRAIRCARGEFGVTRVPGVLAARYVGESAEAGRECFAAVWNLARPLLMGRSAIMPRLWRT